jgi:hypothetical protein
MFARDRPALKLEPGSFAMDYSRTLRAIPLLLLAIVLGAGIAQGQAPKSSSGATPAKPTAATAASRNMKPGADTYSIAAEREALQEIRERARDQVRELTRDLSSLPAGSDRRALNERIVGIKKEFRLETMRTMVYFARGRGDLQKAQEVQGIIDRLLNPRFSVPVETVERAEPSPQKGGRP